MCAITASSTMLGRSHSSPLLHPLSSDPMFEGQPIAILEAMRPAASF
jgi:hypothetical protein